MRIDAHGCVWVHTHTHILYISLPTGYIRAECVNLELIFRQVRLWSMARHDVVRSASVGFAISGVRVCVVCMCSVYVSGGGGGGVICMHTCATRLSL